MVTTAALTSDVRFRTSVRGLEKRSLRTADSSLFPSSQPTATIYGLSDSIIIETPWTTVLKEKGPKLRR
uniref:Uncharacterized protein n=1 Tax=Panagrellus redivivus TaxID=6233 RepID=A0A7E4V8K7_PANRE